MAVQETISKALKEVEADLAKAEGDSFTESRLGVVRDRLIEAEAALERLNDEPEE